MARFRKMAIPLQEREDTASFFSGAGFVLEELHYGKSDADSSESLDEPQFTYASSFRSYRLEINVV